MNNWGVRRKQKNMFGLLGEKMYICMQFLTELSIGQNEHSLRFLIVNRNHRKWH